MWIYATVLSIVGLFALLSLSLPRATPLRPALLPATVLVLALFMGLRDRVGADWNTYQSIFDMYAHADLRDVLTAVPIEPAYAVLNYGSYLVGGGIYLVNFVCAAIVVVSLARFAYVVDVDPILALFLATPCLLFTVGMGYTRQAVAISLGCVALGYWVREEPRKFWLATISAVAFHYSAIFLLLLIWMRTWKRIAVAVPLAVIGGYLFVTQIYTHYFLLYVQNTEELRSTGVWFRLAIVLSGVVLAILQRKRWQAEQRLFRLIASGSAIALCLVPTAIVASTLADRICLYLFFIYLVTFARSLRFSRVELRHSALAGVYITTYACFFIWFAASPYAARSWIPYRSVLLGRVGAE